MKTSFSEFEIHDGDKIQCEFTNEKVSGELKIGNKVFNVYLGKYEGYCIKDCSCKDGKEQVKHVFTLIEV